MQTQQRGFGLRDHQDGGPDTASSGARPPDQTAAPSTTHRTTLYRMDLSRVDTQGLYACLNDEYLSKNGFRPRSTQVAGVPSLVVHGDVRQDVAGWCSVVQALTGEPVVRGNGSAGCALLVAVDGEVYALTYGALGRFMIKLDQVDPGFGIRFGIRAIEPDRIRRVTRRVLASTGRVERSLVPSGQHIRRYGIEGWGEIVGQLCGTLNNERLTVTRGTTRAVSIVAAESLQIAISTDPVEMVGDLREITRVCSSETPSPELDFIAEVRPLRTSEWTAELDRRLDEALGQRAPDGIGLAVPISQIEYEPFAESYLLKAPRQRSTLSGLDLDSVLECARTQPVGRRLESLKKATIQMCAERDGAAPLSPPVTANTWVSAEVPLDAARMVYHEGQWYEIGQRHLDLLRTEIEKLLARPSTLNLPPWTSDLADEDAYNKTAGRRGTGYVLLDKRFLKTQQHNRGMGIEACDLLGPDDELIHVKRAAGSAPLSHLFAQGEVAVDALLHERDARERLVELVRSREPSRRIDMSYRPRKVVYAIALASGKALTADTLFTFAQVALYRARRRLLFDEVEVEVVSIPSY